MTLTTDQTTSETNAVQAILRTLTETHEFDSTQIKTDAESLEHWGKDWTKHFSPCRRCHRFSKDY